MIQRQESGYAQLILLKFVPWAWFVIRQERERHGEAKNNCSYRPAGICASPNTAIIKCTRLLFFSGRPRKYYNVKTQVSNGSYVEKSQCRSKTSGGAKENRAEPWDIKYYIWSTKQFFASRTRNSLLVCLHHIFSSLLNRTNTQLGRTKFFGPLGSQHSVISPCHSYVLHSLWDTAFCTNSYR